LNYEVDISDEAIPELCKSDGDGGVTSERKFAICNGTVDMSHKCVAAFNLYDYKWLGMTTV